MESKKERVIYPLARPSCTKTKEGDFIDGIASFYTVDENGKCYVFLLGHRHQVNIDEILFMESLLKPETINRKPIARIKFNNYFDTKVGLFLQRSEVGTLSQFTCSPDPIVPAVPELGHASIITTVDGFTPKSYNCNIIQFLDKDKAESVSFKIDICDELLISSFGGGRSGMSGSLIVQNNKIVGILSKGEGMNSKNGYCVDINQIIEMLNKIDSLFISEIQRPKKM